MRYGDLAPDRRTVEPAAILQRRQDAETAERPAGCRPSAARASRSAAATQHEVEALLGGRRLRAAYWGALGTIGRLRVCHPGQAESGESNANQDLRAEDAEK
jgi:hypothetical protein